MSKFEELEQKLAIAPRFTLYAKMFNYWYVQLYRYNGDGMFIMDWTSKKRDLTDPLAINNFENGESLKALNKKLKANAFDLEAISIEKWVEDIQDLP